MIDFNFFPYCKHSSSLSLNLCDSSYGLEVALTLSFRQKFSWVPITDEKQSNSRYIEDLRRLWSSSYSENAKASLKPFKQQNLVTNVLHKHFQRLGIYVGTYLLIEFLNHWMIFGLNFQDHQNFLIMIENYSEVQEWISVVLWTAFVWTDSFMNCQQFRVALEVRWLVPNDVMPL